jgi:hypothetical protein
MKYNMKGSVSHSAKNEVPLPGKVYTEADWNSISTILNNPCAPPSTGCRRRPLCLAPPSGVSPSAWVRA